MTIHRITGIYQADGGLMGELRYVLGKLRNTNQCALCDITHGATRKKPSFERCEADLRVPLDLVHLNERSPDLRAFSEGRTPCVVGHTESGFVMLLSAEQLEKMKGSVESFEAALKRALTENEQAAG